MVIKIDGNNFLGSRRAGPGGSPEALAAPARDIAREARHPRPRFPVGPCSPATWGSSVSMQSRLCSFCYSSTYR